MKKITLFIIFLFASQVYAQEWYQGGNLHSSTLKQWSEAANRNKLATASDWIVTVLGEKEVLHMDVLKRKAEILVTCVDTLIPVIGENYDIGNTKTTSTAFLCISQLEANDWR